MHESRETRILVHKLNICYKNVQCIDNSISRQLKWHTHLRIFSCPNYRILSHCLQPNMTTISQQDKGFLKYSKNLFKLLNRTEVSSILFDWTHWIVWKVFTIKRSIKSSIELRQFWHFTFFSAFRWITTLGWVELRCQIYAPVANRIGKLSFHTHLLPTYCRG